jgi:uncharacterized protein (DUF362 family)
MRRRSFLQFLAADAALPVTQRLASAAGSYQVGAGFSSDAYAATLRAVSACGQWPAAGIAGRTVMIKPNLVSPKLSTTGVTTDPEIVRAVVDLALQAGAARVLIAEGGFGIPAANFGACGYGFFSTYNPRVQLMDFSTQPVSLVRVPNGLTYFEMYLPTPAVQPGLVYISVGKMKTHVNAVVSLSMKNSFGLAVPARYIVPTQLARMDCHLRGIDQSIVDVSLTRPITFSVIDGIWGMEGNGPLTGTPIRANVVLAGLNPVAVDRVALDFMQIPQGGVPHLAYAAARGLGPADTHSVTVLGDSFTPMPFIPAETAPTIWRPTAVPNPVSLTTGLPVTIYYKTSVACSVAAQIISDSDAAPGIKVVRGLQNWTPTGAGVFSLQWNGLNDSGAKVSPGLYLARVMSTIGKGIGYATGWVVVNA